MFSKGLSSGSDGWWDTPGSPDTTHDLPAFLVNHKPRIVDSSCYPPVSLFDMYYSFQIGHVIFPLGSPCPYLALQALWVYTCFLVHSEQRGWRTRWDFFFLCVSFPSSCLTWDTSGRGPSFSGAVPGPQVLRFVVQEPVIMAFSGSVPSLDIIQLGFAKRKYFKNFLLIYLFLSFHKSMCYIWITLALFFCLILSGLFVS